MGIAPNNSHESFFSAFSRRFDAAGPLLTRCLLIGSTLWILVALFGFIIPNAHEEAELTQRLERRQAEVQQLKDRATRLYEYTTALEDPYYIEQAARAWYNFREPEQRTVKKS